MRPGSASQSRVLPSMSVKRNVTVPGVESGIAMFGVRPVAPQSPFRRRPRRRTGRAAPRTGHSGLQCRRFVTSTIALRRVAGPRPLRIFLPERPSRMAVNVRRPTTSAGLGGTEAAIEQGKVVPVPPPAGIAVEVVKPRFRSMVATLALALAGAGAHAQSLADASTSRLIVKLRDTGNAERASRDDDASRARRGRCRERRGRADPAPRDGARRSRDDPRPSAPARCRAGVGREARAESRRRVRPAGLPAARIPRARRHAFHGAVAAREHELRNSRRRRVGRDDGFAHGGRRRRRHRLPSARRSRGPDPARLRLRHRSENRQRRQRPRRRRAGSRRLDRCKRSQRSGVQRGLHGREQHLARHVGGRRGRREFEQRRMARGDRLDGEDSAGARAGEVRRPRLGHRRRHRVGRRPCRARGAGESVSGAGHQPELRR